MNWNLLDPRLITLVAAVTGQQRRANYWILTVLTARS